MTYSITILKRPGPRPTIGEGGINMTRNLKLRKMAVAGLFTMALVAMGTQPAAAIKVEVRG